MKNLQRIFFLLVLLFTNYLLFAESANDKLTWQNSPDQNKTELYKHLVSYSCIPFLNTGLDHNLFSGSMFPAIGNIQPSTTTEIQILRLEFRVSNGASRSFVIGFTEDATDGFDYGYDGGLINNPPSDDMGSLLNGQQYVIQAFAPITPDKEIDLVLHASGSFNYTLISTEISNFPDDQDLFMRDNLTGESFNLRDNDGYQFTSKAGTFATRFQVIFQDPSTLSNEEFNTDNTLMYVNGTEGKLYVKSLTDQARQLNMTNMLGQTVKSFDKINNQNLENGINISDLNTGIYIVNIQTENNKSIDKKVIIN